MTIKRLWLVYFGGFWLAVHYATVVYINSSLLEQFVGNSFLNILFIIGSILSIIALLLAPFFLNKYGSVITLILFITLEILAVFGMGSISLGLLVIILFLIHQAAESMLHLCMDLNLEKEITTEGTTGRKRSIFLTFQNIAWVLSPLVFANLINLNNFDKVYFLSGLALIPLFIINLFFFRDIKTTKKTNYNLDLLWQFIKKNKDTGRIIIVQFILNFFYSWMTIYLPLLLNKEIGFNWQQIGIIFSIMLLPFLIFQIPAGFLGDKKTGEKEILVTGFIIIFLTTAIIPFIKSPTLWWWALLLFSTRIGASLIEIASETYFFKHVKEDDTSLISAFRMTRPMSLILAPLLALPIISFFSYGNSFFFLACLTLIGLFFIPKIDTR